MYTYIISKRLDPLFALFIGVSAAASRIHREEKEKGRNTAQTWEVLKHRAALAYEKGSIWP